MRITHNIPAIFSLRLLSRTQDDINSSIEKLSSGLRINRASDDAAGLAISEKMRTQVRGLTQALKNAQDGISLIQTAEAGMQETHTILQRMRDLAVQAANDTYTSGDRSKIQVEVAQLIQEITRISSATQFNTMPLLNGDWAAGTGSLVLHVGANTNETLRINITTMNSRGLGILDINISTRAGANSSLSVLDDAIGIVSTYRSNLGAYQNRLEHTINATGIAMENMQAAESRIRDADMAEEMMTFTRNQILSQAGTAMLAQANLLPQSVLPLLGF